VLTPEQARERLKSFHVEDGADRRKAAVDRLPGSLREVGHAVREPSWALYSYTGGTDDFQKMAERRVRAFEQLEALDAAARARVFEALFPRLGRHVEAMWTLGRRLPYQGGGTRQAFRAPNDPHLTLSPRIARIDSLLWTLMGYEQDVAWVAEWAAHLGGYGVDATLGVLLAHGCGGDPLGVLLAAAIEGGGEEGEQVFRTLLASAGGGCPPGPAVAAMGRHVPRALLTASRPEGWEAMERLLLAAQRQEGLRQVILEAVDEAHPEAFRRLLHLVLQHDLLRFSSAVRALDVWFGGGWEAGDARRLRDFITKLLPLWEDRGMREAALRGPDPEAVYLALWCCAFEDAPGAIPRAAPLLGHAEVGHRFAAAHLLADVALNLSGDALVPALDDPDLRVVVRVLDVIGRENGTSGAQPDLFERLERVLPRFPKTPKELEPVIWPWHRQTADRKKVTAALILLLGDRPVGRLAAYLSDMEADHRALVAGRLAERGKWTAEDRATMVRLVGDASSLVRDRALKALEKHTLAEDEARIFEGYLKRKASDLRLGVLEALLRQPDGAALASAERLLTGDAGERTAGLEMLRRMAEGGRAAAECAARAERYRSERGPLSGIEETHLEAVLRDHSPAESAGPRQATQLATRDDALGLMDDSARSRPTIPRPKPVTVATPAAIALLRSLDDLIHRHRETPVFAAGQYGYTEEQLLGDLRRFPEPEANLTREDELARLPLRALWEEWWSNRGAELRDSDGMEAVRAATAMNGAWLHLRYVKNPSPWQCRLTEATFGPSIQEVPTLRYPGVIHGVLQWFPLLFRGQEAVDFLLDVLESVLAAIPDEELTRPPASGQAWGAREWRTAAALNGTVSLLRRHRHISPEDWHAGRHARFWGLLRWIDEPVRDEKGGLLGLLSRNPAPQRSMCPGSRERPHLLDLVPALSAGAAVTDDAYDLLLGPRHSPTYGNRGGELFRLSGRRPDPLIEQCPALREIVDRCRQRIVDVELARGDTPTAATDAAHALRFTGGLEVMVRVLRALGREPFARGYLWGESRQAVLSHLLRHTFPQEVDSFDRFRAAVSEPRIPESRLVELAVYAPQWAAHVERTLGWLGLASGVWWVHAHTKETGWTVDVEMRQAWEAEVAEFTPLSGADLTEGAVDVRWFRRAYGELGPERWRAVHQAAKYASSSGGHTRAQLFADAMLGRVEEEALTRRIAEKRHQDSVRALGLLPLPEGDGRFEQVLRRYKLIQEFVRGSRQFGATRQEKEKRAGQIALENLARTAGYPDPVRLTWAVEARESADLAEGPLTVQAGDVTVSLAIDAEGAPELTVTKGGKPLKSVPAALKKDEQVAALQARAIEVKRQRPRMRLSLEQAMIRGDAFTPEELEGLMTHPVLAPALARLVLTGMDAAGYPVRGGALRDHAGRETPVRGEVRIAHPFDLLERGDWHEWQQECFRSERVQPFKQVFRELYVLTEPERQERTLSRRYEGHQVNPRQALALFGTRGWVAHPEEGIRKTFHDAGLTARMDVMGMTFTAADVEGLTLETVRFTRRGEWEPLPLESVPPRLFSEVMRDLDLVVSVAHRGGVDPEASASTVEMRAALLAETCELLGLDNVRVDGRWALIEGTLGSYSLHLGSAVVHRQPGGFLCIVPVHAQHRGRLFLPFADDDPKTAEVLSKTLLLARDREIKDPTILEQIRGAIG
jgi:uncharacterized protein DUF5724/uncharacterized protein DUF4132